MSVEFSAKLAENPNSLRRPPDGPFKGFLAIADSFEALPPSVNGPPLSFNRHKFPSKSFPTEVEAEREMKLNEEKLLQLKDTEKPF